MKKRFLVWYVLLISSFLVGCGTKQNTDKVKVNQDGIKVETKEGEKATIKTGKDGEGTIKIEGEDAEGNKTNIEFASDSKLPSDFPKEIPIPKKAEVLNATSVTTDEGKFLQVVYEISTKEMDGTAIKELYKTFFVENNYKIELEVTMDEVVQMTATKDEKTALQVYIAQEENQLIQVSLWYTQNI